MTETVADILSRLSEMAPAVLYIALLVIAYGENVMPPIPGDLAVVYCGYLAGIGRLDLFMVVFVSTVGGSAGFATMFLLGRRFGPAIRDPARWRWIPKRRVRVASRWMRRWGLGVVLANRFLSGTRSVIALTAGMAFMSASKSLLLATVSAAVWTALIGVGGYLLGDNWGQVVRILEIYGNIVIGGLLVLLALLGLRTWLKRRGSGKGMKT